MAVTTLDTHEVVKELMAAGFSDDQAEALTRVVRRSQDIDLSSLATKTDLQVGLAATKADLQTGLAATRSELQTGLAAAKADLQVGLAVAKADLAETKAEILRWMVGSIGVQTVVILGAVVALAKTMVR